MPTCERYTWVKGHFRSNPARNAQTFRTVCAYCGGTGEDPYTLTNKCPACEGRGHWEFKGALSDYSTCGRCDRDRHITQYIGHAVRCVRGLRYLVNGVITWSEFRPQKTRLYFKVGFFCFPLHIFPKLN